MQKLWDVYIDEVQQHPEAHCKKVQQAVARHVADLDRKDIWFDEAAADRICRFVRLCRHTKGRAGGKNFNLQPWQAFIYAMLFGWKNADGTRRFHRAYIQVPRKNGKSEMMAPIMMYMAALDGEAGAECYVAATTREQAGFVFKATKLMSDALRHESAKYAKLMHGSHVASIPGRGGAIIKALSSEAKNLDGSSPLLGVIDEYHAHPNSDVLEAVLTGMGERLQPLLVVITTAGANLKSPCAQLYDTCAQILDGSKTDDSQFIIIYELDDGDDWRDETKWPKANPNLGVSVRVEKLRIECNAAQNEGFTKESHFRTKHLNQWMRTAQKWVDMAKWRACGGDFKPEDLVGLRAFGGLDISSTRDTTSYSLFFPVQQGLTVPHLLTWVWMPGTDAAILEKRAGVPLRQWQREGWLSFSSGDVVDYDFAVGVIVELAKKYNIVSTGYDRAFAATMLPKMHEAGIEIRSFGQGMISMTAPTSGFETLVASSGIRHNRNPVLEWQVGNALVVHGESDTVKISKEKSNGKVDAVVASVMAYGEYLEHEAQSAKKKPKASKYQQEGVNLTIL